MIVDRAEYNSPELTQITNSILHSGVVGCVDEIKQRMGNVLKRTTSPKTATS